MWLSASDQYIHVLNQSSKGRDNPKELGDFYVIYPVFPFLPSFLIRPKSLSPKLTYSVENRPVERDKLYLIIDV